MNSNPDACPEVVIEDDTHGAGTTSARQIRFLLEQRSVLGSPAISSK
jgi:hypothetical protein